MKKLLDVSDLKTYFYTDAGVVKAVNGISYTLSEGETLGIVGESGCGKSVSSLSLMRLIYHPGRVAGGKITFRDRDLLTLSEEEMRRVRGNDIAMIFQDPMTSLNPVLTISRQMTEALELHMNMDSTSSRKRAIEMLKMVGIPSAEARIDDYPHHFSGGMRQRVMIAMALSCNPKLLIADEPTTALDVTIQAQILDLIKNIRRELGTAVILITHDLGVVAGMCDKIAVMYAGYIVEMAPAVELFDNPQHPYTLGLLSSIPKINDDRRERLIPIEGLPPDLIDADDGCPFVPRCGIGQEACRSKNPPLAAVGADHTVACWVNAMSGASHVT